MPMALALKAEMARPLLLTILLGVSIVKSPLETGLST